MKSFFFSAKDAAEMENNINYYWCPSLEDKAVNHATSMILEQLEGDIFTNKNRLKGCGTAYLSISLYQNYKDKIITKLNQLGYRVICDVYSENSYKITLFF